MIPFVAVLALAAVLAWALLRPGSWAPVVVVLVLPLAYATWVLHDGFERLDALELSYVGKQVTWGPGHPITGGGTDAESGAAEDLYAGSLGADALRIEPASEEEAAADDSLTVGDPVLRLAGIAPVVEVDGRVVNAVPLAEGDLLRLALGNGDAIEAELRDGALETADGTVALPGRVASWLQPGRVAFLPDLLDGVPGDRVYSFLDRGDDGWRVVLRDEVVRVVRDGAVIASLDDPHPLPRRFDLRLRVVSGDRGARTLRTVRSDRVTLREEYAEIRFATPERRRVPLAEVDGPLEMALVVPSSSDRRPQQVELDERSQRFHGLSATLRFEPRSGEARIEYLGGGWAAERDELYGLGEGRDLMLVRLERTRFPWQVPLDLVVLALLSFFLLAPALRRSPGLVALVGSVGLLLADRLLFAYRAAVLPPDFFVLGLAEARLAVWLLPSTIFFGATTAYLLRNRPPAEPESEPPAGRRERLARLWQRTSQGARRMGWPLTALVAASLGAWFTVGGERRSLAVIPVLLAALLLVVHLLAQGPLRRRLRRWDEDGWSWPLWGLAVAGAAFLAVRWFAQAALGMPETIRVPGTGIRLLWTAVQLPLAALLAGIAFERTDEERDRPLGWLVAVASAAIFLVLAFVIVGGLVNDGGLALVHGLALVFALVLLVRGRRPAAARRGRPLAAWAAAVAIAVGPLLLVLAANLMPETLVRVLDTVRPNAAAVTAAPGDEIDVSSRMRATTNQQLFRLYMLANPEELRDVGLKPAERAGLQYATLKTYAAEAGLTGDGFQSSNLPRHLGVTYLNDLMPMAFVLADFGKLGMFALALTYLLALVTAWVAFRRVAPGDRWGRQGAWIATLALLAFALPGLYMTLANLNLVLFTGKNCALLSLNSLSDVIGSAALVALAAFGATLAGGRS